MLLIRTVFRAGCFRTLGLGLLLLSGVIGLSGALHAAGRVALVIGNSDYADVAPLANPVNDAADIGEALDRIGFDVTVATDLTWSAMQRNLRDFARRADDAEMAVVYFAGHGMEIDNRNYLVPVDAEFRSARDVPFSAVELQQLLRAVEGASDLQLVILDACRDNPFLARFEGGTRAISRGLAVVEPAGAVVVAYAARGGTVAYDGEGRNSPYTAALLRHLEDPGLEIGQFFRRVRDTVYRSTGGRQEPFHYGSLPARDIFLAAAPAPDEGPQIPPSRTIWQDFAAAELAGTAEAWRIFLAQHGATAAEPALIARAATRLAALSPSTDVPRDTDSEIGPSGDASTVEGGGTNAGAPPVLVVGPDGIDISGPATPSSDNPALDTADDPDAEEKAPQEQPLPGSELASDGARESVTDEPSREHSEEIAVLTPEPDRVEATPDGRGPLIRACDRLAGDEDDPDLADEVQGVRSHAIAGEEAIRACTAAIDTHPEIGRLHYQLGRALLSEKDKKAAMTAFEEAYSLGHASARVPILREQVVEGATPAERQRALIDLHASADAGLVPASLQLGELYEAVITRRSLTSLDRNGELEDSPVAHYRRAAERGSVLGAAHAGRLLFNDRNISPKRGAEGEALLRAAALGGHTASQVRLGMDLLRRSSLAEWVEGTQFLETAARSGDTKSMVRLADAYRTGRSGRQDLQVSTRWVIMAARAGNRASMVEAAWRYETGYGVEQSAASAAGFYIRALSGGNGLSIVRASNDWDRETARAVQRLLRSNSEAAYSGALDGVIGPQTRAAMGRLCGCGVPRTRILFKDHFKY